MPAPPRQESPRTMRVLVSDAAIKRYAPHNHIRQLHDTRRPVLLRYGNGRDRGSWYVLVHSAAKNPYKKVGNWPALSAGALFDALPGIMARLAVDPASSAALDGWQSVGQLLDWYSERLQRDSRKSKSRKQAVATIIKRHLRPRLGSQLMVGISRGVIDAELIWPLQERYSPAYVRQIFGVLIAAFRQADRLKLLASNPVAGFEFPDFVPESIPVREGRVRPDQIGALLEHLLERSSAEPVGVVLAYLMLCHGTRIGETRMARWDQFNLAGGEWFIPARHTKTGEALVLPLTSQVCSMLERYRAWQKSKGYGGVFLFPGVKGRCLANRQASECYQRLGNGEWTGHDLRKAARTGWADLDINYLVSEALLNHALKGVSAAYIHTELRALKRTALERWHAWLDGVGLAELRGADVFFASETGPRQRETGIAHNLKSRAGWLGV